jgi:hypothetical protein
MGVDNVSHGGAEMIAAIVVQSWWRTMVAVNERRVPLEQARETVAVNEAEFERNNNSSSTLLLLFSPNADVVLPWKIFHCHRNAAIRIQSEWRSCGCRAVYRSLKSSSVQIQSWRRTVLACSKLKQERAAAIY